MFNWLIEIYEEWKFNREYKKKTKILTMIRRIKKPLLEFFEKQTLTDGEKSFILGCMNAQKKYPQLTHRQWQIVCEIKDKYNEQVSRSKETP